MGMKMEPLILIVRRIGRGRYAGFIGGKRIVKSSYQPFLDAARRLLRSGVTADAILVMRHAGQPTDSLRAPIGDAGRLTVDERQRSGPRFSRWQPFERK